MKNQKSCLTDRTILLVPVFASLFLTAMITSVVGQNQQEHPQPRDQNQGKQQVPGPLPDTGDGEFHQQFHLREGTVISPGTLNDCCEVMTDGFPSIATGIGMWYGGPAQYDGTSGGSETGTVCEDQDPCACRLMLEYWGPPNPCPGDTVTLAAYLDTRGDCENLDCTIKIYRSGDILLDKGKPSGKRPGTAGSLTTKYKLKGGQEVFTAIATGCPCGYDLATVNVPAQVECCGECKGQGKKKITQRVAGKGTFTASVNFKCDDITISGGSFDADTMNIESLGNALFEFSSYFMGKTGIASRIKFEVNEGEESRKKVGCKCSGHRIKIEKNYTIHAKLQTKATFMGVTTIDYKTVKKDKVKSLTLKAKTKCCKNCEHN